MISHVSTDIYKDAIGFKILLDDVEFFGLDDVAQRYRNF